MLDGPEHMTNEGKAIFAVTKRVGLRRLRSYMRDKAEAKLAKDITMSYEQYEQKLVHISTIGRGKDYNEAKAIEENLRLQTRSRLALEGAEPTDSKTAPIKEDPVDLVQWGPLVVDQEGSIKFDPIGLWNNNDIAIKPAEEDEFYKDIPPVKESLLKDNIGLHMRIKLGGVNPLRLINKPEKVIGKYRFSVKVDHFTDITYRKMFSNEFELNVDHEGDIAFFYNFTIPLR